MFDKFAKKESVESLTEDEFQKMVVETLYEMVFLSYFNEPSFDEDAFSGHILDKDNE